MSEELKQAVVDEPNAQAKPDAAGSDARNDGDEIDRLLSQYTEAVKQPDKPVVDSAPQKQDGATSEAKQALEEAQRLTREIRAHKVEGEITSLVDRLRGDSGVSPRAIRGWLEEVARENPKISEAFFNPKTPKDREQVEKHLAKMMKDEFPTSKLDSEATKNREVVSAAVRGSSKTAPEAKAPDYARASNNDFKSDVESKYGYTPRV